MNYHRLWHTVRLHMITTGSGRANYIREHNLFHHIGDNCMVMFRKLPLYGELISFGNNVHIASNVSLITHDVTHNMLNFRDPLLKLKEYIGCIEIGDNVFVGANTTILYNSMIPSNTIIGANSFVNKPLPSGGVYAGCPVKYICTIEEFLNKRSGYSLSIKKSKTRLSDETIESAWKRFENMQKK